MGPDVDIDQDDEVENYESGHSSESQRVYRVAEALRAVVALASSVLHISRFNA